jgi:hypothetical protein
MRWPSAHASVYKINEDAISIAGHPEDVPRNAVRISPAQTRALQRIYPPLFNPNDVGKRIQGRCIRLVDPGTRPNVLIESARLLCYNHAVQGGFARRVLRSRGLSPADHACTPRSENAFHVNALYVLHLYPEGLWSCTLLIRRKRSQCVRGRSG